MTQVALISPDLKALSNYYEMMLEFPPHREAKLSKMTKLDDIVGVDKIELHAAWFGMDGAGNMMELMQCVHPKTEVSQGKKLLKSLGYSFSFEVEDIQKKVSAVDGIRSGIY